MNEETLKQILVKYFIADVDDKYSIAWKLIHFKWLTMIQFNSVNKRILLNPSKYLYKAPLSKDFVIDIITKYKKLDEQAFENYIKKTYPNTSYIDKKFKYKSVDNNNLYKPKNKKYKKNYYKTYGKNHSGNSLVFRTKK